MAVKFRDYYQVLGVPRTASADEIKQAYRKLARTEHPDLKPQSERATAAEHFKEINEAYEVLRDPEKRSKYDALGANWKGGMDWDPPPGAGGRRTARRPNTAEQWEDFGDFSDFFESLFGGARASRGAPATFPGRDVEAELPVTVDELLRGGRRRIGVGDRNLDVEIPRGGRDGTRLRLTGQGEPGFNGGPAGDLYLVLRVQPNERLRVEGDDLEMDLALWPWQAVLGASVRVETPDGAVKLEVPAGTPAGRRMRLRGRGLPRRDGGDGRGDLYARIVIAVPERPSAEERAAYEALKQASQQSPDRPAEV